MYKDLLKHTDLAAMKYKPHLFTLNGHVQGAVYFACELFYQIFSPIKYSREILELTDGGTVGLDWLINPNDDLDIDEKTFGSAKRANETKRPLLIFVPGMSGTSKQMYSINMMRACLENNVDGVVVNYRGLAGVPLVVSKCFPHHRNASRSMCFFFTILYQK